MVGRDRWLRHQDGGMGRREHRPIVAELVVRWTHWSGRWSICGAYVEGSEESQDSCYGWGKIYGKMATFKKSHGKNGWSFPSENMIMRCFLHFKFPFNLSNELKEWCVFEILLMLGSQEVELRCLLWCLKATAAILFAMESNDKGDLMLLHTEWK